jgi:ribosomal protein S18 acetylase RimI-like enzyme
MNLRQSTRRSDVDAVRTIVSSTGFFSDAEIDIAVELIEDNLARGEESGYHFLFADDPATDRALGYACFGGIAGTQGSFDLYWIAVHRDHQREGLGTALLAHAERIIAQQAGRRVYVETSSRAQYESTRRFYLRSGYTIVASLDDFYAPGDGKVILCKALQP